MTEDTTSRLRAELRRVADEGGPGADDAEIALGSGQIRQRLRSSILALARHRGPDSSICPSDAARAISGQTWRDLMPDARELARELVAAGHVVITQRGEALDPNAQWSGPIRITAPRTRDADVR
ncbi:DUF3253 domain-containing protein [Mycobacterium asiaticum]|uniref:DUF3253 domain-containing protein n=1 Tax=Mycobacterium asiaticum TaxID=1790 RepID=UPI000A90B5BD|nr:DUF3253 domain-containing protein [Mycobacterium asiaticum]